MRDDIYGILKNALERGDSLEKSIRSLINSGYNESEIREVAKSFTSGAISMVNPIAFHGVPQQTSQVTQTQVSSVDSPNTPSLRNLNSRFLQNQPQAFAQIAKKKSGTGKIILLIFILVVLIGILVATLFFRESVIGFLNSIFG